MIVLGGKVFGMWLGQEGGALMNGSNAFIKEIPERPFAPYSQMGT